MLGNFRGALRAQESTTGSTVTYALTPEVIDSLFKLRPGLRQRFQECVPHQMSEKEFWLGYIRSEALYSQSGDEAASSAASRTPLHDLLTQRGSAAAAAAAASHGKRKREVEDPMLDVSRDADQQPDGYGTSLFAMRGTKSDKLKQLNQDSVEILSAAVQRKSPLEDRDVPRDAQLERLHKRIRQATIYEDLCESLPSVPPPLRMQTPQCNPTVGGVIMDTTTDSAAVPVLQSALTLLPLADDIEDSSKASQALLQLSRSVLHGPLGNRAAPPKGWSVTLPL